MAGADRLQTRCGRFSCSEDGTRNRTLRFPCGICLTTVWCLIFRPAVSLLDPVQCHMDGLSDLQVSEALALRMIEGSSGQAPSDLAPEDSRNTWSGSGRLPGTGLAGLALG